jgi:hypothetical protein
MPVAGPFFFAWVDQGAAFDPTVHNVMDEYVFSVRRVLAEGQKPVLMLQIRNPHIGLLNVTRKSWAYFSWDSGSTAGIVPLFYGRLVGVPSDIFGEVIEIQFIAWPVDYQKQVQALAESLKSAPFDPIFVDVAKADDPDTVLEVYSSNWHVDAVTHVVTASDILLGEDGNVDVSADDAFYDSMSMRRLQAPLTAIQVDASVSWRQTARGFVDIGNKVFDSYSWDGIYSEWPKPLSPLGAGWSVQYSIAVDVYGTNSALVAQTAGSYQNTARFHSNGDTLALNWSYSVPNLRGGYLSYNLTEKSQSGVVDPFAVDENGDPAPLNIPGSSDITTIYCPLGRVSTSLVLRYDADRQRTERVIFRLTSDLQAVILDPLVSEDSELITLTGRDVGVPLINLLDRTTVSGQHVDVGTIVFPDYPSFPGGTTAQIYTTAGTTAAVEPEFSDVPGTTTTDGTAVATSLGVTAPTDSATDWTAVSGVAAGTIILPRLPLFVDWTTLVQPGLAQFPQVGVPVSLGDIVRGANSSYHVCTLAGTTGIVQPGWGTSWGSTLTDGSVEWTCLGTALPDGKTYFLATSGGVTGAQYLIPPFGANTALHATVSDGSGVVWTSIGPGDIPAGGTSGNVWASQYFTTSRGQRSLQHILSVARARLLKRARAIEISFECAFALCAALTCRKTVTLHDPRISGGVALGKVIRAELSVDGETGVALGKVTMGCAVGNGNVVAEVQGTPAWVAAGWVDVGWQTYNDSTVVLPFSEDIGYTPPVVASIDDGLVFPLDRSQIVVADVVHGTLDAQVAGIQSSFRSQATAAQLAALPTQPNSALSITRQQIEIQANANSVALQLQRNPIWWDFQIKPVVNGPFNAVYNLQVTPLQVPKMIDLAGASTP